MSDPTGHDGLPAACGNKSYEADPLQHARCTLAGEQVQRREQMDALSEDVATIGFLPATLLSGGEPGFVASDSAATENAASDLAATSESAANDLAMASEDTLVSTGASATDATSTATESGAGQYVDFAHGTTSASAQDIVSNGINREASLANMVGSREPGSFYTVQVDPLNPTEALELAASWATRHNPQDICIVICRLPVSVVNALEGSRLLVRRFQPPESIFRPDSFDIVNQEATWFTIKVR